MKILMTGGTGFLGSALRERLAKVGRSITCLSRSRVGAEAGTTFVPFEALADLGPHEAVINLAGESVVGRWTATKRRAIFESRIGTTRELIEWIERCPVRPKVFLSGSAVGVYGDAGEAELTERSDVSRGEGFLAKVCRDWEQAASPAGWRGTRTIYLRTGHVLDPGGGYLAAVLPMMRRFPIVVLGPPKSFIPWISLADWVEMTLFAMDNEAVAGPLNLVSPHPVSQGELAGLLAAKLGKHVWGSVPRWALKLAIGEFGESITVSQRVFPEKALAAGWAFAQDSLASYLDGAILKRKPSH